ncbi:MAG: hypothetical protein OHK0048_04810 [Rhodoferax sp.]
MIFTPVAPMNLRRHLIHRPVVQWENASVDAYPSGPVLTQDEHNYILSFDVPGVNREQLAVGIEGNVVRLTSVQGAPRQYRFACELPQDIDPAQSSAKLENGVLTLTLAKLVPASRVTELVIH